MSATIPSSNQTRIVALLLTLLVLFAAAKVRAAETPRSDEELRTCQCDTDPVAAIPHQFALQGCGTAVYLLCPGRVVCRESPTLFSHAYRGPPALF